VETWRAAALAVRHGRRAALDAMGRDVRSKAHPRWWGHALDHHPGQGVAYGVGRRQAPVCRALPGLCEPWGMTRAGTDGGGAYERQGQAEQPTGGQAHPQPRERKPINLRTRIKRWGRRTMCFSTTERRHDLVIGLFIKRYALGVAVGHTHQQL